MRKSILRAALAASFLAPLGCEVADVEPDLEPRLFEMPLPGTDPTPAGPSPLSDPELSGHTRQLRVADDGSFAEVENRLNLSNRTSLISQGAEDDELVLYSRLDGTLRTGVVHPGGGWEPLQEVGGVEGRWDTMVRGEFVPSNSGPELALYDLASGELRIRSLGPGFPILSTTSIGTTWTAIAAGQWSFFAQDELALYDHARGLIRILRPFGSQFVQVAEHDAPQNMDHMLAVHLEGPQASPALVLHNVDNGDARVVDISWTYSFTTTQLPDWPTGESLMPVAGDFVGSDAEDVAIYDAETGVAEVWESDGLGNLSPGNSAQWGEDYTHGVSLDMPGSPRSDALLYSNMVTVLVDFMRVHDSAGNPDLNFPEDALEDQRGPARSVAWLNQSYRMGGMRFEVGDVHDVYRDDMRWNAEGAAASPCAGGVAFKRGRKYARWLSHSECVQCVEAEAPSCDWGSPLAAESCDVIAEGPCAAECPAGSWWQCDPDLAAGPGGCLDSEIAPNYVAYCDQHCPAPAADRLILSIYPKGGTRSCSGPDQELVYFSRGALNEQYFLPHEVGHYLGLSHAQRLWPPVSNDPWDHRTARNPTWQAVEGPVDIVGMFNNRYFTWLGIYDIDKDQDLDTTDALHDLDDVCDERTSIEIPDSGSCLSDHGGNGCTDVECRDCVELWDTTCFRRDKEGGPIGEWDGDCVDLATNLCQFICDTGLLYEFEPARHNPMAYGSEACSEHNGIYKFSPGQLQRAREHLLVHRPGLVVPTLVLPQLCPPLSCVSPLMPADTDWDGCPDTCQGGFPFP